MFYSKKVTLPLKSFRESKNKTRTRRKIYIYKLRIHLLRTLNHELVKRTSFFNVQVELSKLFKYFIKRVHADNLNFRSTNFLLF